jgi:hypothetical protein
MARQPKKEVNSLKKKLEASQRKEKDATDDLQVAIDGTLGIIFRSFLILDL